MMKSLEKKKQKLHQLVDILPPERLDEAETLLKQLGHEARVQVKHGKPMVKLGGLWEDLGVKITESDIAETRQEMWGRMGRGQ